MIRAAKAKVMGAPTPMAGLALGIASLGWSWENMIAAHGVAQWVGAAIASVLLIVLAFKFLWHGHLLRQDLAHPVVGSVVPTFAMATMVVSASLGHFYPVAGDALWLFAVGLHILFLVSFLYHRAQAFELHHMVPSWFVPPVGIIVADVSFSLGPSCVSANCLRVFSVWHAGLRRDAAYDDLSFILHMKFQMRRSQHWRSWPRQPASLWRGI